MVVSEGRFKRFSTHPSCRIVIDSCTDVTPEIARRLGVDVIEFPFVMEDGDHLDDQFVSMSCEEFYARMRAGERVLTSAIPVGVFMDIFESCALDAVPTLYLSFTAGLSRSVFDAAQAAQDVCAANPGFQLLVVDNCNPSLSGLMIAIEACRLRDGGRSVEEIAQWVRENRSRLHGYFTLDSLDRLAAGGRIPKAASTLSNILDMKANLTYDLDGALTLTGVSRGRKKAMKTLVKALKSCYVQSDRPLAVVDADCAQDADRLEEMVREELAPHEVEIIRLRLDPTIGAHVGPGMVALAFWGTDRSGSDRGKR